MADDTLLDIRGLNLWIRTFEGENHILKDIGFDIRRGERFAVVGESGSGKTVTARLAMGLMTAVSMRTTGSILFNGRDVGAFGPADWRQVRGRAMTMIFQDPIGALNPVFTVGDQLIQVIRIGGERSPAMARRKAIDALGSVMLTDPERILAAYPFQLSGGIAQRVNIAMALVNEPELVIADEPGTALDATVQQQSMKLMRDLTEQRGTSVMLISHNLGVVRSFATRMTVMNRGEIVETGEVADIFARPRQAYTRALIDAVPSLSDPGVPEPEPRRDALLEVRGLTHVYRTRGREVRALDQVDMTVPKGSCTAVVGESGSGKTTLGRLILAMEPKGEGDILFDGQNLGNRRTTALRRRIQVVQQNPTSALNPRRKVADSVGLPLQVYRLRPPREQRARVDELLTMVGLDPSFGDRYPGSLSGGQKQRVAMARALASEPELLVLDEPTSALDVSVQAHILKLLSGLREELDLTYLFITHDLGVVRRLADRVVVLYHGKIVETGATDAVFANPGHGYTRQLLASVPVMTEAETKLREGWTAADNS